MHDGDPGILGRDQGDPDPPGREGDRGDRPAGRAGEPELITRSEPELVADQVGALGDPARERGEALLVTDPVGVVDRDRGTLAQRCAGLLEGGGDILRP